MNKHYTLDRQNVIHEVNAIEDQFQPPSFPFVPPQVGANAVVHAPGDEDVMPSASPGSLYYNTTYHQLRTWSDDPINAGWVGLFGGNTYLQNGADVDDIHGNGVWFIPNPGDHYPPITAGGVVATSTLAVVLVGAIEFASWYNQDPAGQIFYRVVSGSLEWSPWYLITSTVQP
jgi:hypothetical protein